MLTGAAVISGGWQLTQAFGRKLQWVVDKSFLVSLCVSSPSSWDCSQHSSWVPEGAAQGKQYPLVKWQQFTWRRNRLSTSWSACRKAGLIGIPCIGVSMTIIHNSFKYCKANKEKHASWRNLSGSALLSLAFWTAYPPGVVLSHHLSISCCLWPLRGHPFPGFWKLNRERGLKESTVFFFIKLTFIGI